jgi:hypothetical protein
MTLIRLIQRASILAGMTFAGLSVYGTPAHADTQQFCVIASNGKTVCGTLQLVERACIITENNNTVCGKFKSAKGGQAQEPRQEISKNPTPANSSRTAIANVTFSSKGCSRSDTNVKCSFSIRNKGAERNFGLYASTATITDSSGKTYMGSSVEMGGQTNTSLGMTIAPEIDYEVTLTFENVPGGVTKVQVLSFPFDKTVNLRNITISN